MVIQGENKKLSLHQALRPKTLADYLLLIAYEGIYISQHHFMFDVGYLSQISLNSLMYN